MEPKDRRGAGDYRTTTKLWLGVIAIIICFGYMLYVCFVTGSWLWIPISAGALCGIAGYHEITAQNDRRGEMLKKNGIDELLS